MQEQLCMDLAYENKIDRHQVYKSLPEEVRAYSERVADYVQILYHTALDMGIYKDDVKLSRERLPYVRESVRMFDIGYAAIPDFLRKKEILTEKEKSLLERHTAEIWTQKNFFAYPRKRS